jgi:hypothetical protein
MREVVHFGTCHQIVKKNQIKMQRARWKALSVLFNIYLFWSNKLPGEMIINWEEGFSAGGGCEITTVWGRRMFVCLQCTVDPCWAHVCAPLCTSPLYSISFLTLSSLPSLPFTYYVEYVPFPWTFFHSWLPFVLSPHFSVFPFSPSPHFLHFLSHTMLTFLALFFTPDFLSYCLHTSQHFLSHPLLTS